MARNRSEGTRAAGDALRRRIADEAARLVSEHGLHDLEAARRKAGERLGVRRTAELPTLEDVESALRERQRLFRPAAQAAALDACRRAALRAMEALVDFTPRLVGAVLDGTADQGTPIQIQLHCDEPEAVLRFLEERGVKARSSGSAGILRFVLDGFDHAIEVLPADALRQPQRRPDGSALPRAGEAALRRLLEAAGDA